MLLETHSIDSLHDRLFFGLLACRTCSHINCQECRKSTSQDWYLIRKYHCKVYIFLWIFKSKRSTISMYRSSQTSRNYTHLKSGHQEDCVTHPKSVFVGGDASTRADKTRLMIPRERMGVGEEGGWGGMSSSLVTTRSFKRWLHLWCVLSQTRKEATHETLVVR